MARKRKTIVEEEVKTEPIKEEKPVEKKPESHKINSTRRWIAVKNNNGDILGSIEKGTSVIGEFAGDRFKFTFNGTDGYVKRECVS